MNNSLFAAYRRKDICVYYSEKIKELAGSREFKFMEVCGTHTQAFFKFGLKSLLPENIRLISGPGCPVCVTPNERIDTIIAYGRDKGNIIATFGDLFRVPGSRSSFEKEKAAGADIRIVYSPLESVDIALQRPEKRVIFFGIGFETTAPSIAATLLSAKKKKAGNWFLFCANKVVPGALELLASSRNLSLDGFMCPGHVSAIIGVKPYHPIAEKYGIPCVITGFEPVDIFEGIYMLVKQAVEKKSVVEIQYSRVVRKEGNRKAIEYINEVFVNTDSDWRGLGRIKKSGLKIKDKYGDFDIEKLLKVKIEKPLEPKGCICGEVLKGTKTPLECGLFAGVCRPENPVGACMVSSEGTCSAYYKYER